MMSNADTDRSSDTLGILPFVAALMMWGTRRFKAKADDLLEK